jgi:hypothetical protein
MSTTDRDLRCGSAIEVDLRNGKVVDVEAAVQGDDELSVDHPIPAHGTGVLDAARVGPHRYELAAPTGGRLVLRAVDERTGIARWELLLDAGPSKAPRPLRP